MMKPETKQKYRPAIQIIKQILQEIRDGGRDGISISTLARNARTGHTSLVEKCQKLVDANLLKTTTQHKSRKYYITEEGIQFLALLDKYENLLQAINIK